MPVFQLDSSITFPDPSYAQPDGLLAVGGDLSVERLLLAYSHGIFPWYNKNEPILWWCPHERFIIRPEEIHVSHSLKKYMKKHVVKYALNRDFSATMHKCRIKREFAEGTWIHDEMEEAYKKLFDEGYALSLEAVVDGVITGGLYGVSIGKCFFGESMYSDRENGSKLALVGLANLIKANDFLMIDCQFHTDHLESMGGVYISYDEYSDLLKRGIV
ncbi:MAG: leucyl/phenylalanyl-tRNA--protein transferase [Lachnospiraceae bacterium]|nr:leucyl/phenylalanyl-tRNA--protein transferase [Lachnospiraceae bacterium]